MPRTRRWTDDKTLGALAGLLVIFAGCNDEAATGAICGNLLCEDGERRHCDDCDDLPDTVCGDGICQHGETITRCQLDCMGLSDLVGTRQLCEELPGNNADAELACASDDVYGEVQVSEGSWLYTYPSYVADGVPCQLASVEEVAGVIELRTCAPRYWSRYRMLASQAGPYTSFFNPESPAFSHQRPLPATDTSLTAQCDELGIDDNRCDAVPEFTPGTVPELVGAWQACLYSSNSDPEGLCELGTRDVYMIVSDDGTTTYGCSRFEGEFTHERYGLRSCGRGAEVVWHGELQLGSDGGSDYVRIDDPGNSVGSAHFVRVDLSVAEAACATVRDARCPF